MNQTAGGRRLLAEESICLSGRDPDRRVPSTEVDGRPFVAFGAAAALPLVLQSARDALRQTVERMAAECGLSLDVVHEQDSTDVIRSLHATGAGFTFTPATRVEADTLRALSRAWIEGGLRNARLIDSGSRSRQAIARRDGPASPDGTSDRRRARAPCAAPAIRRRPIAEIALSPSPLPATNVAVLVQRADRQPAGPGRLQSWTASRARPLGRGCGKGCGRTGAAQTVTSRSSSASEAAWSPARPATP